MPFERKTWSEPRYLIEGDKVWLPCRYEWETGKMWAYPCVAMVVAGDHARIVFEPKGIDRWARLSSLLVPPEHPRHWNQAGADEAAIRQIVSANHG